MDFRRLNIDVWNEISSYGSHKMGYKGVWLGSDDDSESSLHLFKDEVGDFHFAIEVENNINAKEIVDPKVNGLSVSLRRFLLEGRLQRNFIDIRCNIHGYLPEFTKVVKSICAEILNSKVSPVNAVNGVIKKWIAFWNNQNRNILSEERQIGLICELTLLRLLCEKNPEKAISSWVGPFRERHDFVSQNTSIEVKGTRREARIHTINGIDQLLPFPGKSLLFVSFLVSRSDESDATSLPYAIEGLYNVLEGSPLAIIRLNELLYRTGYSPIHSEDYEAFRFRVTNSQCYWVNNEFPFLSSNNLSSPFMGRISSLRYDITLEGIAGIPSEKMDWDRILGG